MKWTRLNHSDRDPLYHKQHPESKDCYELSAPGKVGKRFSISNAHTIRAAFHYNGGGEKAFGGSTMWPHLELNVSFEEGQCAKRDELVKKLQDVVAEFFKSP